MRRTCLCRARPGPRCEVALGGGGDQLMPALISAMTTSATVVLIPGMVQTRGVDVPRITFVRFMLAYPQP